MIFLGIHTYLLADVEAMLFFYYRIFAEFPNSKRENSPSQTHPCKTLSKLCFFSKSGGHHPISSSGFGDLLAPDHTFVPFFEDEKTQLKSTN